MQPYYYQQHTAHLLTRQPFHLLDADMGTGKTIMALTAVKKLNNPRTLVVCPAIAVTNWIQESKLWGVPEECLQVISYDKARNDFTKSELLKSEFEILILDEAHYLKTPQSKRTQAIYGRNGLAHHAKYVWLLSGTFAPNNASEYYPHLKCLFNDLLPERARTQTDFTNYFCETYLNFIKRPKQPPRAVTQITGNKNAEELKRILAKASIRISAEEVLPELPPLQWSSLAIPTNSILANLSRNSPDEVEQYISFAAEELPTQPSQSVMQIRRLLAESKIPAIVQWLQEFIRSCDEKIVIFSNHVTPLRELHRSFTNSVLIDGSVPSHKRGHLVNQFQGDKTTRIFLGQQQAAGTAITLTAARRVLFIDLSFVPAENQQAAARCHRIGQHRPVLAQVAMIPGSVDEQVAKILVRKNQTLAELQYEN